jgi:hypothetical protein
VAKTEYRLPQTPHHNWGQLRNIQLNLPRRSAGHQLKTHENIGLNQQGRMDFSSISCLQLSTTSPNSTVSFNT